MNTAGKISLVIGLIMFIWLVLSRFAPAINHHIDKQDVDSLIVDTAILSHQGEIRPDDVDDETELVKEYYGVSLRHFDLVMKGARMEDSIVRIWAEQPHDEVHKEIIDKIIDRYNSLIPLEKAMKDSIDFYHDLLSEKSKPIGEQKSI